MPASLEMPVADDGANDGIPDGEPHRESAAGLEDEVQITSRMLDTDIGPRPNAAKNQVTNDRHADAT